MLYFITKSKYSQSNNLTTRVDIDSLKKNNVKLYNCAGVNSTTVAEHALGLLICGAKNILSASRETYNKIWNRKILRRTN